MNTVVKQKIKVLIIDDSALIRSILREIINSYSDMVTVGAASNPHQAREMIKALNPDVLTLDVEMPEMDGLTFLEKLMRLRPMPVLMISSLTQRGSDAALRSLELGAIDFVAKPKVGIVDGMQEYADEISEKIRVASCARIIRQADSAKKVQTPLPELANNLVTTEKIIVVGASTGGTEAIREFLIRLPADAPGVLIVQHMSAPFMKSFANRLNGLCKIQVKEAEDNERVLPGHAYIAPGDAHLLLRRSGANYMTELSHADPVNRHRPSVDMLFRSAAKSAGKNVIGVILTGMGKDGAAGMLEMHLAGAYNLAQNEASCVVFGMPKEAIATGAVDEVVPVQDITQRVLIRLIKSGGLSNRV